MEEAVGGDLFTPVCLALVVLLYRQLWLLVDCGCVHHVWNFGVRRIHLFAASFSRRTFRVLYSRGARDSLACLEHLLIAKFSCWQSRACPVSCTWSTWSAVGNRTSRAGEQRSAPDTASAACTSILYRVCYAPPPNEHTSEGGRDDRGVPYQPCGIDPIKCSSAQAHPAGQMIGIGCEGL